MTEAEWLASDDTWEIYGRALPTAICSDAAVRDRFRRVAALFGVACVRATPQTAKQPFLLRAAAAVERAADDGDWAAVDVLNQRAGKRCGRVKLNSAAHYWALAALRLTDDTVAVIAPHVPFFMLSALQRSKA